MTVALTSIKISTDFDSGNIQVLDASDAYHLLLAIKPDTRSAHFQWFHFKAEGMHVGHTHTFRLSNASQSSYKTPGAAITPWRPTTISTGSACPRALMAKRCTSV